MAAANELMTADGRHEERMRRAAELMAAWQDEDEDDQASVVIVLRDRWAS